MRYRFALSTFLGVAVIVCVSIGLVICAIKEARNQENVIEILAQEHGNMPWVAISYDGSDAQVDPGARGLLFNFRHQLTSIELSEVVVDDTLRKLPRISSLRRVVLVDAVVTDDGISQLRKFPIEHLIVDSREARITSKGIDDIAAMSDLRTVLLNCKIPASEIQRLSKLRPHIRISIGRQAKSE